MHLQDIWHHNNLSLDLNNLHQEILDIQNAKDTIINPKDLTKDLLDSLQGFNLLNMLKHTFWILAGIECLLVFFCAFSVS